ncbi:MAG: dihydroorotate dehydrogenase [Negativicutes bacterium]|nr:dihydroorotate dehydrogenase [Negativicutes bacterium]
MDCLGLDLCGLPLANPLIAASGCFGFGLEQAAIGQAGGWGGIVSKAVTAEPRTGNRGRRLWETPSGLMNSIGLENPGVERFIAEIWPRMRQELSSRLIVNVSGSGEDEYCRVVDRLAAVDADMIEVNISCPNVRAGGMAFGLDPDTAGGLVSRLRGLTGQRLMVKLSPNAADIVAVALACQQAGADCLSLVNTFQGLAIDVASRRPVFDNLFAGLSGPAIKPLALRAVYLVSRAVAVPVVGMGGIQSAGDVVEFILAGATAVQIGTANFYRLGLAGQIAAGLEAFCREQGLGNLQELRGGLAVAG